MGCKGMMTIGGQRHKKPLVGNRHWGVTDIGGQQEATLVSKIGGPANHSPGGNGHREATGRITCSTDLGFGKLLTEAQRTLGGQRGTTLRHTTHSNLLL